MKTLPKTHARIRGFTLTELLVVIAIIAVLAYLLMPTITRMRDAATANTCSSNMRQCIAMATSFSTEQNGRLPRLHVGRNRMVNETGKTPLPVTESILSNEAVCFWPDLLTTYAEGASMFSCPKLKVNATQGPGGGKSNRIPLGIGINYPYMAPNETDTSSGPTPIYTWVRLSSVPDQGRVVWFADAGGDVTGDWNTRTDVPGFGSCFFRGHLVDGQGVMPRHGGKINVGFVDGHVALVYPSEINWGSKDTDRRYIAYTKF